MRKFSNILLMILSIVLLVSCGASKLSKNYSEKKLKAGTETVAKNLDEHKYQAIVDSFTPKLRKKLAADQLKQAWEGLGDVGKYNSISKLFFQEQKKDQYVTVVAIAKYEKKNIQLTVSFNKDMELVGLYMK
ncbi:DUF3887 domain-containing protein [Clostridium oryzae]|uniref:DUF3887 domain-containing protein n=1 Tax=Clostridium oryzae TaxID=1450648 RepID=A0A1V4ILQ4_9CLOT|nr:DUF3887 domain-containing protein [Clostridium oryzae]OPJ60952.1 hypothetical protein CLORY_25000 [Clostridium oryzae]